MNKLKFMLAALAVVLATVFAASEAQASTLRTFVASTGADGTVNCPRTTPCRNFAYAYTQTLPGGEIVALDAAGYGSVTITTAVTIEAAPGVYAAITVGAGSTGITVSAGASDNVVLRNLIINGGNAGTNTGALVSSGRVFVQNTVFQQLTTGLRATGGVVDMDSCTVSGNSVGVRAEGAGPDQSSMGGINATVTVIRVSGGVITQNATAFEMFNPGTTTSTEERRSPGSNNAQNIFVRRDGGVASLNISGNARFLNVTGLAEFNGSSAPDGTIGQYQSQLQNASPGQPANGAN